jgi:hypothetical protein
MVSISEIESDQILAFFDGSSLIVLLMLYINQFFSAVCIKKLSNNPYLKGFTNQISVTSIIDD